MSGGHTTDTTSVDTGTSTAPALGTIYPPTTSTTAPTATASSVSTDFAALRAVVHQDLHVLLDGLEAIVTKYL